MRWPERDQAGAGGNVRGTTGPRSSRQRVVAPVGGSVEQATTAVLVGRRPWRLWPCSCPSSGCAASGRRRCAGCGARGCGHAGCRALGPQQPVQRASSPRRPPLGCPPGRVSRRGSGSVAQGLGCRPGRSRRCARLASTAAYARCPAASPARRARARCKAWKRSRTVWGWPSSASARTRVCNPSQLRASMRACRTQSARAW
jgi:hypothetical protein